MKLKGLFIMVMVMLAALSLPASGLAVSLTLGSVDGTWQNPVGGVNVTFPNNVSVVYGNGSQNQVRWGIPVQSSKSGLGFTGVGTPLTFATETIFEIGQLQHFNFPIQSGTAASAVDLQLQMQFTTPPLSYGPLFTFGIDETPNVFGTCVYGDPFNPNPCPDSIFFPSAFSDETVNIGGDTYKLELIGFGTDPSHILSQFITQEGQVNSALLFGKITAHFPDDGGGGPEQTTVPEPSTMILMGGGLLGLLALKNRNRK